MNWLTFGLLAVIGLLTFLGWRNGFVRELVGLASVILAVPVAGIFYDDMYPNVYPIVDSEPLANLISFLAIFAGVIVGGQVLIYLLRNIVAMLNLGFADQAAGGLFGFAKAVLLCQAVLIALVAFPRPDLRADIERSGLARGLLDAAPAVLAILPGTFDRALDAFMDGLRDIDERVPGDGSRAR